MTSRSAVVRMVKMVAAEVAEGQKGDASQLAMEAIGRAPEMAADLLALIIKEGAKKRPVDDLISAYSFLLGHALEQLRYAVDRDNADAIAFAETLRTTLVEAGISGRITPSVMLLVLHLFAGAKLEIGDALRDLMQRMMDADTSARATVKPGTWSDHLANMVEELEGDAFAIHGFLDESITAMPKEMWFDFITETFAEAEPALREATIGFLCSDWSSVRFKVAELIEQAAPEGLVSPTMLRRLIGMRNWLPAEQRPALDRAIRACRQSGVACASWQKVAARKVLATGIDGSGAHSVLVIVPEQRKHAIASLLGKVGVGVRDAWVKHDMTEAELRDVESRFAVEAFLTSTTLEYAAVATQFLLAMNVAAGTMPPFGLLNFAETVGLESLNPEAMPVGQLLDKLSEEIAPERLSPQGIDRALAASARWSDQYPVLGTWFEDNAHVRQLLTKRNSKTKQRTALLTGPLQEHRHKWAELLAWTAFAMKHQPDGADWSDFAVIARELLADRPLSEIPLMCVIAESTLTVNGATRA